jgi:glycosyltransferase involved in cell wall biosynthesis
MKISVIIPTYNRERFVVEAIDSVLNQSYTDFEIIIIDDGSTDNTKDVLKAYEDKIRYYHQTNSGVSAARNAGIKAALGKWIAFLDSDDKWEKDYLSTQIAQIERYPQAIGHVTNAVSVHSDGERSEHFVETKIIDIFSDKSSLTLRRPLRTIINFSPWFLQSIIIRKDILINTGLFDPELSIAEDLDVIAQAAIQGPFSFNNKVLVEIVRRTENIVNLAEMSKRNYCNRYQSFAKAHKHMLNTKGLDIFEKITIRRHLGIYTRAIGNTFMLLNNKKQAMEYYIMSIAIYPSFRSIFRFLITLLPLKARNGLESK